ncbi:MAG: rhodanese-like domain-containing protein [Myxococcota bacterium]
MQTGFYGSAAPNARGFRDVTVQQVHDMKGRVRVVDVRETAELHGELGHIEGVEHVPLSTVVAAAAPWPRHEEVVVVCRSGGRSGNAAAALVAMGFTRVMNMVGGMLAWNAAGLPVAR